MKTKVFTLSGGMEDMVAISEAAAIIQAGGLVAFPTETVYGLGANSFDRKAVEGIYAAKKRPFWDPIISHVESPEHLIGYIQKPSSLVLTLAGRCMPGAVTILVDQSNADERFATASNNKVSLRVPNHKVAQNLIKAAGVPIAAPSANLFGRPSPTTAQHVLEDLDGRIHAILDAGLCIVGVESTVIDITTTPPTIMRPGGISLEEIEKVIGKVIISERSSIQQSSSELSSPGTTDQHYSPRAKVLLVHNENDMLKRVLQNKNVGVMLPSGWKKPLGAEIFEWGNYNDLDLLAQKLFFGFRELDKKNVSVIICPVPQKRGIGLAIYDRLQRAAS